MSGNGSRTQSRYYGTEGPLLPTPRSCSGLRSSGANQTELLQSAERVLTKDGLFTTPTSDTSQRTGRYAQGSPALSVQAASTCSPPATPASPFPTPGGELARRTTATSGRFCRGYSALSGPVGSCLRTLLGTSRWASTTCWLTWKPTATPGGRRLFRLAPSTPPTAATGSGLWPTPNVPNGGRGVPKDAEIIGNSVYSGDRKVQVELHHVVERMWPKRVGLFPTPAARDGKGQDLPSRTGGPSLPQAVGKLSADWVEALMNYPPGWTDLSEPGDRDGRTASPAPSTRSPTG